MYWTSSVVLVLLLAFTKCQIEQEDRLKKFTDDEDYQPPIIHTGRTVSDGTGGGTEPPRRRYPSRNYDQAGQQPRQRPPVNDERLRARDRAAAGSNPNSDPGFDFRQPSNRNQQSFPYEPYARDRDAFLRITTVSTTSTTRRTTTRRTSTTERVDPFDDPDRYRVPQIQQAKDNVRFVNGRPYREPSNIQDRYGNRYDPRFHSIPGEYDPEDDPRFSDPRYQDPRNLPKYNNNRHKLAQDRYDSKYRYYERFPERQKDRLKDPNYDPRWDPDDPPVPGVLGGWLPELQGECRPGCENLPRDVTINTNYGRVNGFYVYLYDGPRVPEFDRPTVANVDKIKAKVSVFLGIPYAQAPIGEARLMVKMMRVFEENYENNWYYFFTAAKTSSWMAKL